MSVRLVTSVTARNAPSLISLSRSTAPRSEIAIVIGQTEWLFEAVNKRRGQLPTNDPLAPTTVYIRQVAAGRQLPAATWQLDLR